MLADFASVFACVLGVNAFPLAASSERKRAKAAEAFSQVNAAYEKILGAYTCLPALLPGHLSEPFRGQHRYAARSV